MKEDKAEAEKSFQKIFENNPIPLCVFDAETLKILLVNKAAIGKYGYSEEEFLALSVADLRPLEERNKFLKFYKSIQKENLLSASHGVWKHKKKNGETMLMEVTSSEIFYKGKRAVSVALMDITERENGRKELMESEERFRLLANSSLEGIVISENNIIVDVSEQFVKIFGYEERKEVVGKRVADFIHPADEEMVVKRIKEGSTDSYEARCVKKDGSIIIIRSKGRLMPYHGGSVRISVLSDITNQKESEKKLRQSEESYRNLVENNLAAVFRTEVSGALTEFNNALVKIFGYDSIEELKSARAQDLYFSLRDRERYLGDLKKKGYVKNYQMRMRKKDGSEIWILENVQLVKNKASGTEYIEGTLIDITESKKVEQALQEREENYKSLIEHTPDGILIHDEKGRVLFANRAALRMLGINSLNDVEDTHLLGYVLPAYHNKLRERRAEMEKNKDIPFFEIEIRRPDGNIFEAEIKTSLIFYHGKPAVEVVLHDIALQRQAQRDQMRLQFEEESNRELKREIAAHIRTRQRLNANQKYIRLLIDSSLDMIFACDQSGKITEFNPAAQKLFGYLQEEAIGKDVCFLYAEKDQCEAIQKKVFKDGNFVGEATHLKKNKETFPAYISSSILKNERGEIIGAMSNSRDITRIKEAEDQLKKSVHEKEILLKEIHHRVKNNMQVISSILKLQSTYVKDKKTIELFDECRNRISSMAFIHATLYMKKDFANINFSEYVSNLAGNLQQSYVSSDKKILLKLDVPDFNLHIDDAIPCGLIINELLSNSFKYAFVDRKKGTVGVSVKIKKENVILAIWDDGAGFPKKIDYKNTESLGLQLVNSLTEQLRGKIKLESEKNKGSKFIIAFRKSK